MRTRGKRARLWPEHEEWLARRDAYGMWRVVNLSGEQPLVNVDTLERMKAVHLAAAAPAMRAMLEACAGRLRRLCVDYHLGRETDGLANEALILLAATKPPHLELTRVEEARQLELLLEPYEPKFDMDRWGARGA